MIKSLIELLLISCNFFKVSEIRRVMRSIYFEISLIMMMHTRNICLHIGQVSIFLKIFKIDLDHNEKE